MISLFIVLFASCFSESEPKAVTPTPAEIVERGDAIAAMFVGGEIDQLVEQLHIPATYSSADREEERRSVRRSLDTVMVSLGPFSGYEVADERVGFERLEIEVGDPTYWDSITVQQPVVSFQTKNDEGRIVLLDILFIIDARGELLFKGIGFGVAGDDAPQLVDEIFTQLTTRPD